MLILLAAASMALTACSNKGSLNLEPGAIKVASKGSPYMRLNVGANAMVVEQGQTPTTGVHGWISLQPVSSKSLASGSGAQLIINKTQEKSH